jgi:23S rRNA pseudouridine1911/1915/1917 synthase
MDLLKKVEIIFENEDFLAINKPAGLLVHPTNISEEKTLVDWIAEKHPEIIGVGDASLESEQEILRPGIVHRLDRDTSGIMLIAKNNDAFFYLKNLFQEKKIKKNYSALVFGNFSEKLGMIDKPIGIKSSSIKRSTAAKKIRDVKEAQTEYKVIKNYSLESGRKFALLEVYPKTGRTNQIRVHLASIGHSVVGDKVYGSQKLHSPEGLERMFLHAFGLEMPLKDGSIIRLEADLPEDLINVLNKFTTSDVVNIN